MALYVTKGDINAVRSSALVKFLKKDSRDCERIKNSIVKFINYSGNELSGPAYDSARSELEQYISILDQRKILADSLADAIKSGCSSLSSYMGKYSVLDERLKEQYINAINAIKNKLNALEGMKRYKFFDYWGTYFHCMRLLREYQDYLDKLEGLPGADDSAYSAIGSLNIN